MIYVHGWCSHSNLLYACVIIKNYLFIANFAYWARVNAASCVSASIVMAKKFTMRCSVYSRCHQSSVKSPLCRDSSSFDTCCHFVCGTP